MDKTGIIILAAGPSSRLGKPKQLLVYKGKTLLENIVSEARKANLDPAVVVTGSGSEAISSILDNKQIEIVYNKRWPSGMASGIVAGLSKILTLNPKTGAVIIAVCDQPYVSAELFGQLMKIKAEQNKGIVGCAYAGIIGTPVLFGKIYFEKLLLLQGEEGAKKILKTQGSDLASVNFDKGSIDIDKHEDYDQLLLRTR
jgi:molybdenum cofactor cytidylyltransferase